MGVYKRNETYGTANYWTGEFVSILDIPDDFTLSKGMPLVNEREGTVGFNNLYC